MKRKLLLSFALCGALFAETIEIKKVVIEGEPEVKTFSKEVESEQVKFTRQQDLGEILFETTPEINLVRASAIGNDLIFRGFKKDDINVLIDGAKIYGACPNRMDPPAMHVSASQIKRVIIKEGPFDVENFGSMGGMVNIQTKEPQKGFGGDISYTYGSFDYNKLSTTLHAGDDKLKVLLGYSKEESNQYEDGNGKNLVEQQLSKLSTTDKNRYQSKYKNARSYLRDSFWSKFFINIADNQKLKLNLSKDKATNVLYPAFQMDAQLDDASMIDGEYSIYGLSKYSKKLSLKAYYSHTRHDMGTEFREYGLPATDANGMFRTHRVRSTIKGAKLENSFDISQIFWKVGLDTSIRNWNGICLNDPSEKPKQVRIPDVETKNYALFLKAVKKIEKLTIKFGSRYDKTDIEANNFNDPTIAANGAIQNYFQGKHSTNYKDLSANLMLKYNVNDSSSFYIGVGQGIRVPDGGELYFISYDGMNQIWKRQGNPDLKETKNREVDIGYNTILGNSSIKISGFYSNLQDYIYAYKNSAGALTWANIDAHIYGGNLSFVSMINDEVSVEGGVAYQRGEKDSFPSSNQHDKDMAQIPPLKGRVALGFDNGDYSAKAEVLAASKYSNYDSDNGEKELSGWAILNLKASKDITNRVTLNLGVDNLFDKAYAVNNTYVGRSLIGGTTPVLINEPGRFVYANLDVRF